MTISVSACRDVEAGKSFSVAFFPRRICEAKLCSGIIFSRFARVAGIFGCRSFSIPRDDPGRNESRVGVVTYFACTEQRVDPTLTRRKRNAISRDQHSRTDASFGRSRAKKIWPWVQDELDRGIASSFYPRTGRVDGVGKNQLGKLLMQVREEYRL